MKSITAFVIGASYQMNCFIKTSASISISQLSIA